MVRLDRFGILGGGTNIPCFRVTQRRLNLHHFQPAFPLLGENECRVGYCKRSTVYIVVEVSRLHVPDILDDQ